MPDSLLLYCCRANIFKSNIRSFYFFFKYSFLSKITLVGPLSCIRGCIAENWVAHYEETSTVWMMWIDAIWSRKTPPLYTVNLFDWRRTVWFHASRESQKNILVTRCLVCMRTWLFVLLFRLIPHGPVNVVYSCVVRHQLIAFPCSLCNPKLTLRKLFRKKLTQIQKKTLSLLLSHWRQQ